MGSVCKLSGTLETNPVLLFNCITLQPSSSCRVLTKYFCSELSPSSNIYAVSRNVEDPLSAKMTPMMSDARDYEQSLRDDPVQYSLQYYILKKDTDSVATENELSHISAWQAERSEINHPKYKYCAEASMYGTTLCTQVEAKRVHYLKEYPLYYFLGYTHFSCQLEPGRLFYTYFLWQNSCNETFIYILNVLFNYSCYIVCKCWVSFISYW